MRLHPPENRINNRLLLLCLSLLLAAPCVVADEYRTTPGSEILVSNMPAARDQGELAFCYAAVPTILVQREYCRQRGIACDALAADQQYSMLHMSAMRFNAPRFLQEYGDLNGVLLGLKRQQANGLSHIASEACAPYISLARQDMPERPAHHHLRAGWEYLSDLHERLSRRGPPACIDCELKVLQTRMNLRTPRHQLESLLTRDLTRQPLKLHDWMWRITIPGHCLQRQTQQVALPRFGWHAWPENEEAATADAIHARIVRLLQRDIPVSIAYCSAWELRDEQARCRNRGGHASVITGSREVCANDSKECWNVYRVQNSFGQQWQDTSYQVWLLADELVSAALELQQRRYLLTWIEAQ